jgi:hypothetical protein
MIKMTTHQWRSRNFECPMTTVSEIISGKARKEILSHGYVRPQLALISGACIVTTLEHTV